MAWWGMAYGIRQGNGQANIRRTLVSFCALAMAAIGILALLLWGVTWGSVLLLVIGAGCLASIFYSWLMAKRVDRELDRVGRGMSKRQK